MKYCLNMLPFISLLALLVGYAVPAPESIITESDRNALKEVESIFQAQYDIEVKPDRPKGQQFATLYYGPQDVTPNINQCKKTTSNKVFLADVSTSFDSNVCNYCAAIPKLKPKSDKLCSERIIFGSLENTNECPKAQGGNTYMFSFYTPCDKCADAILEYATKCVSQFNYFIVGYNTPLGDPKCKDYAEKIFTPSKNVAMTSTTQKSTSSSNDKQNSINDEL